MKRATAITQVTGIPYEFDVLAPPQVWLKCPLPVREREELQAWLPVEGF
jgi:hypothetical protein